MTGKIARIMDKGFGFISVEGQEKDLFFHASELAEGIDFNSLKEGQEVSFEMADGQKGPMATNVTLA
jgi:CspA family cold shock protein